MSTKPKYILTAPDGVRIVGTAESLLATASVAVYGQDPDGTLLWEHDGEDFKDYPETSETRKDKNGELLFTDEIGRDWPESKLLLDQLP